MGKHTTDIAHVPGRISILFALLLRFVQAIMLQRFVTIRDLKSSVQTGIYGMAAGGPTLEIISVKTLSC